MRELITDDFAPMARLLDERAADRPGYSAQLAIYHRGQLALSYTVGDHLAPDGLSCVHSTSKGLAAMVIALLVQDGSLDPEAPIEQYWPEFTQSGKTGLSVGQVLSHQAGVLGIPGGVPAALLLDSTRYAAMLAEIPSFWPLGQHTVGYHPLSMGTLMEELVRRVSGRELKEIYEERIRGPLGVDAYLCQPAGLEPRFRPSPAPAEPEGFTDPFSLAGMALNSRAGFQVGQDKGTGVAGLIGWANQPAVRAAGPASVGAVADAQSLAAIYAASFGPVPQLGASKPLLDPGTWSQISRERVYGLDRISGKQSAFALGFTKGCGEREYGSIFAYGHDGAGGSLAFADPAYKLGFAYVPASAHTEDEQSMALQLSLRARHIISTKGRK